MASSLSEERTELQEDEEKLQTALQQYDDRWDSDGYSEEEEEEDQLLIDLDYETSEHTATVRSLTPSLLGSASQSHSNLAGDEESGEAAPRPSLELPSQLNVVEQRADPQKTLALNQALQGILEDHIEAISAALAENKEKQARLEEDALEDSASQGKKPRTMGSFRAPYFRFDNSYPPSNEDVQLKKQSADYDIMTVDSGRDLRSFKKSCKLLLRSAVVENCLEQLLKPVVARMEAEIEKRNDNVKAWERLSARQEEEMRHLEDIKKKIDSVPDVKEIMQEIKHTVKELEKKKAEKSKEVEESNKEIAKYEQEIEDKRNTPEDELLANVDSEKVDWMKIAKSNYGGHSWLDCQKAWEHIISPAVNRGAWSKKEEEKLKELVNKSDTGDWQQIATNLGGGRTAFQCFSHYQQHFNNELKSRPWTKAEDEKLVAVTNNIKDSMGFYSWSKVAALIDSRSPMECMFRFTKIDPSQNKGRWSELEDAKLLAAVELIGPSWSKVAKFLGTRNMVQCRDRYLNCLAPSINFTHFTYDEDVKLLKLYKEWGPAWARMVPKFHGRTDSMLLSRYRQLEKWKQQVEWFERQTPEVKDMLMGRSLTAAERLKMQMNVKNYLSLQLGVTKDDYHRRALDLQNGVDPDIVPPRPPRHLKLYTGNTASNRKGALLKWSWKLDVHRRLKENVQRLVEKEMAQKKVKRGSEPPRLPIEVTQDIMEQSVNETLQSNETNRNLSNIKNQARRLESALNKAFLSEGTVSVQDLLEATSLKKRKKWGGGRSLKVDAELKAHLRRKSRNLTKSGRTRRFFEKDTRPSKEIEAELDELDKTVPLMLLKSFGTDLRMLCNSARLKCLDLQEESLNLQPYEEDPMFQEEKAKIVAAIEKHMARTDISDSYRQHKLSILNGKLKSVQKIFKEKQYLERRVLENRIDTFQDDLDHMATLVNEQKEMSACENLSLMACSPLGSINNEFVVEDVPETAASSSSSAQSNPTFSTFSTCSQTSLLSSSIPSSSESPASLPSVASDHRKSTSPAKLNEDKLSESESQGGEVSNFKAHMDPSSAATSSGDEPSLELAGDKSLTSELICDEEFVVPTMPAPKTTKKRVKTRGSLRAPNEEPPEKKFKTMSREELAEERGKIPVCKKKIFTNLPFLPPSFSTLNSLRALLLMRNKLVTNAGRLYKPQRYCRKGLAEVEIEFAEEGEEGRAESLGGTMEANQTFRREETERIQDSGVWFLPTTPHELSEQARQFQGFLRNRDGDIRTHTRRHHPQFDSITCESMVAPRRHKADRDNAQNQQHQFNMPVENESDRLDKDFKPIMPEDEKNPSGYQLVIGPAGIKGNTGHCVDRLGVAAMRGYSQKAQRTCGEKETRVSSGHEEEETDIQIVGTNAGPMSFIKIERDAGAASNNTVPMSSLSFSYASGTTTPVSDSMLLNDNSTGDTVCQHSSAIIANSSLGARAVVSTSLESSMASRHNSGHVLGGRDSRPNPVSSSRIIITNDDDDDASVIELVADSDEGSFHAEESPSSPPSRYYPATDMELPEPKVCNIIHRHKLKNKTSNVVLVGVDQKTNRIVHFKEQDKKFTPYESIPVGVAEAPHGQKWEKLVVDRPRKRQAIPDYMRAIRETNEYKLLLARFRSIFMWAVLISTVQPSPLNDGTNPILPKRLSTVQKKKPKKKRTKRSQAQKTHLLEMRQASLEVRRKRKKEREEQERRQKMEDMSAGGVEPEEGDTAAQNGDLSLEGLNEEAGTSAGGEEPTPTKKQGRPKGSKNKKRERIRIERPKRSTRKEEAPPQPTEPSQSRVMPQWWRDAVLAAMMSKKAQEEDGDDDEEVNIEEDEDFMDKGDYSDDEWLQQLREEEEKKKVGKKKGGKKAETNDTNVGDHK